MPCGCFGKKNAQKKSAKNIPKEEAAVVATTAQGVELSHHPPSEINGKNDDDPVKAAKRRDVVASYNGENCALLGYRPTGSRPPSCVDSPSSPSRTPSTAPLAPSPSSPLSSMSASPSSTLRGALCRAELAEKRREFFSDFVPEGQRYVYRNHYANNANASTTLPTIARARHFGEVRVIRPVSQPSDNIASPLLPSSPPGPHLLRPTPPTSKIDHLQTYDEEGVGGFSSPAFLRELRNASEEMSKRWVMTQAMQETDDFNDIPVKTKEVPNQSLIASGEGHDLPECLSSIEENHSSPVLASSFPSPFNPPNAEDAKGQDSTNLNFDSSNTFSTTFLSSEQEQFGSQGREDLSDSVRLVPPLINETCPSSQIDPPKIGTSDVSLSQEGRESSPVVYHSPSPMLASEGELSQDNLVLIDGEKVYVENIEPESVFMSEERDSDQEYPPLSSGNSSYCDNGSAIANFEELQPILETDSDQEIDQEEPLLMNLQPSGTHPNPEHPKEPTKNELSTNLDNRTDDPVAQLAQEMKSEKETKIGQIELSENDELWLPEGEDVGLIRQSSSDVD